MRKYFILIVFLSGVLLFAQEEKTRTSFVPENTFSVTIGGSFFVTGSFPVFINERVDQFVTRIFSTAVDLQKESPGFDLRQFKNNYSLRNIKLKRATGEEIILDLAKYRKTGDISNNPYLKTDDVLIFPAVDLERNFVTVSGAVMEPGKFHFMEGDRLEDFILFAGGENMAIQNRKIRIYRSNYEGTSTEIIDVKAGENIKLENGDRIVVDATDTGRQDYNILVMGEVNKPGRIPIAKNSTTLAEVLERVGGIKPTASLKQAKLYTGTKAEFVLYNVYGIGENYSSAQERLTRELINLEGMRMYRLSGITYEDTAYFAMEDQLRILTEGTRVDLSNIETDSALSSFVVKNGDVLVIPKKPTSVYVFGSVANPGHVHFVSGKDAEYYINLAGGYGDFARSEDAMLIKGNTREWITVEKNPQIEEGDYIFVPRDEPRPFNYYVDLTAKYFAILGGVATVVLLFLQF